METKSYSNEPKTSIIMAVLLCLISVDSRTYTYDAYTGYP